MVIIGVDVTGSAGIDQSTALSTDLFRRRRKDFVDDWGSYIASQVCYQRYRRATNLVVAGRSDNAFEVRQRG